MTMKMELQYTGNCGRLYVYNPSVGSLSSVCDFLDAKREDLRSLGAKLSWNACERDDEFALELQPGIWEFWKSIADELAEEFGAPMELLPQVVHTGLPIATS